ncbi:hypothetical protein D9M70_624910 [compost metagenome]
MKMRSVFVAFGTLLQIGCRTNPYRQLLREGAMQGRRLHPGDVPHLMTLDVRLREATERLGILINVCFHRIRRQHETYRTDFT